MLVKDLMKQLRKLVKEYGDIEVTALVPIYHETDDMVIVDYLPHKIDDKAILFDHDRGPNTICIGLKGMEE